MKTREWNFGVTAQKEEVLPDKSLCPLVSRKTEREQETKNNKRQETLKTG
jgi:hypothetical protein